MAADDRTASSAEDGLPAEVARHRRRARVFGDVLPDSTTDDRGDAWGDREGDSEEWLRRQVPPHHG
jgi:hypothetical protein